MTNSENRRVIIAGAGPGGAGLALVLSRRGIPVTLLERHADFDREFRGEWLNASGRTALEQMGLTDELHSIPSMVPTGATVFIGGKERFTMRAEPKSIDEVDQFIVPQPALLRKIIECARQNPDFRFEPETVVRDVIRVDGRVVGVTGTQRGDDIEHRGDLVIAADGRASALRRASSLQVSVDNRGAFDMLWFKAPPPPDVDPTVGYQFLQRNGTAFTHPHPDGVHQWGWAFIKGTYGELRREGRNAWVEAMGRHVPPNFAAHLMNIRDGIDAAFLEIVSYHLTDWYVPGLLLIGDAAHPMSAVGGQGINMALRDAVVTANHVGPVLLAPTINPSHVDAAAGKIAPERLPEISKIQKMQAKGSKILNLETKSAQFMMERIVPLLGKRAGPILAKGVGTTKAFTVGVTTVNLEF